MKPLHFLQVAHKLLSAGCLVPLLLWRVGGIPAPRAWRLQWGSGHFTLHDISPTMIERAGGTKAPRRSLHNMRYNVHGGGGGGSRMQVLSRAADAAQFESPNEIILFHWGKCTRPPSLHYSLLLFPSPPPTSFSPSLPPIAPHRIQFCSFIPTSSPARSLLFISRPLISSPHLSLLFQRSLAPSSPPAPTSHPPQSIDAAIFPV